MRAKKQKFTIEVKQLGTAAKPASFIRSNMKRKLCLLLFFCSLFTAPALWAQQKATPKSGEGISSFLLRHNRAPKKYYDDFIELNKTRLGKSRTLKMGVTYLIPPVKKASAPADTALSMRNAPAPPHKATRLIGRANVPL